jgi:hypothetical protein
MQLGKEPIIADDNLTVYRRSNSAYAHRKILWISRYRYGKKPKIEELCKVKIIIE